MTAQALRMRRDLRGAIAPAILPHAISLVTFIPAQAAELHALLSAAFVNGGGRVPDFAVWWDTLAGDAEYDPALVLLACAKDSGAIVGVAQCWTSSFVKDLAVDAAWRRRGLGRALLLHAFAVFAARGATHADLKVKADNVGAIALYESVGMVSV